MKKNLFLAVAALAFSGCLQDEVMTLNQQAIKFDNAFVDNVTRAAFDGSYTIETLKDFQVYATISNGTNVANIFNGEVVSKTQFSDNGMGDIWKYNSANTQYWVDGNTYNFWAIADGNVEGVTKVIASEANKYAPSDVIVLDASKQKDILFADAKDITEMPADGTISFSFTHLLAKAKFTVKNAIPNPGYRYLVSNIAITNAQKQGKYSGNGWIKGSYVNNDWTNTPSDTYTLSFGNAVTDGTAEGADPAYIEIGQSMESNWERLLIPVTKETFNISFKCQLFKEGVLIQEETRQINAQNITLEKNKTYNFVITLATPGVPIKFNVAEVNTWDKSHTGYNPGVGVEIQ